MTNQIEISSINIDEFAKLVACSMSASVEDDEQHKGHWSLSEDGQRLVVTTRFSRNPNLSSNGGDYYFYDIFEIAGDCVIESEDTSCDIDWDWGFVSAQHRLPLTDLEGIVSLAEAMNS